MLRSKGRQMGCKQKGWIIWYCVLLCVKNGIGCTEMKNTVLPFIGQIETGIYFQKSRII